MEMVSRADLDRYAVLRSPFKKVDVAYVTVVKVKVNKAFAKLEDGLENVALTSETASTMKIALIRTEKISSVNRVKYLTRLDADVIEEIKRIAAVQSPVQV